MAMPHGHEWIWVPALAGWMAILLDDLRRRRGVGAILLDLGGRDWVFSALGCLFVSIAIARFFFDYRAPLLAYPTFLAMGIGMIALGSRRFQLREAGFWSKGRLIPWNQIEAYEVSETGSLSLKLPGKGLQFYCKVPPAVRAKAEDLLASKRHALQPKA
jgi:hypothetical protein